MFEWIMLFILIIILFCCMYLYFAADEPEAGRESRPGHQEPEPIPAEEPPPDDPGDLGPDIEPEAQPERKTERRKPRKGEIELVFDEKPKRGKDYSR